MIANMMMFMMKTNRMTNSYFKNKYLRWLMSRLLKMMALNWLRIDANLLLFCVDVYITIIKIIINNNKIIDYL